MYGYVKIQNGIELYHHGVKGQKWGVRRERNNYDYKKSKSYKSASKKTKSKMTQTYNENKYNISKKAANKIEYDVHVRKIPRDVATNKVYKREKAKYTALRWSPFIYWGLQDAAKWYKKQKYYVEMNNVVMEDVASKMQLNEIKGGFTPGFKQAQTGKKIYERAVS